MTEDEAELSTTRGDGITLLKGYDDVSVGIAQFEFRDELDPAKATRTREQVASMVVIEGALIHEHGQRHRTTNVMIPYDLAVDLVTRIVMGLASLELARQQADRPDASAPPPE